MTVVGLNELSGRERPIVNPLSEHQAQVAARRSFPNGVLPHDELDALPRHDHSRVTK